MIASRIRLSLIIFLLASVAVVGRLFYWQILASDKLAAMAADQHYSRIEVQATRGRILTSDNFTLVTNEPAFLAYAYTPLLDIAPKDLAKKTAPLVASDIDATSSKKLKRKIIKDTESTLSARLSRENAVWVPLARKLSQENKNKIEDLNIKGINFQEEQMRYYAEASMAAHLLGFVGSDVNGNPKGYFGIEGFYDLELKGRPGIIREEKDASGNPILVGDYGGYQPKDGRSLKLYLNRSVQKIVESELEEGLERYGAVSGEVIIMDPKTGGIISTATLPKYEPKYFNKYDPFLFKNPTIADAYEPGSTFKVLVMAAALDADAVEPDTKCDICGKPADIGKYTIKTWNEEYTPDITMTEVIQHSDNVGMVYAGFELGKDKMYDYLQKFGFGEPTGIDLQEETVPALREKGTWGDIDLATTSFGQGIAVTAMQMVKAVGAIANDGILMQPKVVDEIVSDKTVKLKPKSLGRVISEETAEEMTKMMINAVSGGEAQWTYIKGYSVAGKTGTAQIALQGHYDEKKTIASFIGFAPADDPKFVMLVKLKEPSSSPWAAETAAPLWMRIAKRLFLYYNISPGR